MQGRGRHIVSKILGFVFILVFVHVGLFVLYFAPAPQDPFGKAANENLIRAYGALPLSGHVRVKFHHALNHPPYGVGLFGNSRIVMVGHKDVNMAIGEMFNFAVGGTSFLQSVALLEELAKAGKAPDVSIISLDHPEIQFFGYAYWPEPVSSVMTLADDAKLFYVRTNGNGRATVEAIKMFKNSLEHAWMRMKELWSYDAVRRHLRFLSAAAASVNEPSSKSMSRLDGSILMQPILTKTPLGFTSDRVLSKMSNGYLENAIIRLGRLVRTYELKVIIYESPIAPEIAQRFHEAASPYALETQRRMLSLCAKEGLDCRMAPIMAPLKNGPYWPDCCHAPAAQLGHYIRTLINDARRANPNAIQ